MNMKAYAKINLSLDVLYKRTDGYHELSTVMAQTGLYDEVQVERASEVRVEADMLLPHDNTAFRAATLFQKKYGCGGAHIYIKKRIPSEAGLGGASADGAAVLKAMQALYASPASEKELYALAREIGADVPFCLHGGIALCEGIGEILTPVLTPLHAPVLLVKGNAGVSTAALFSSLALPLAHPATGALLSALQKGSLHSLCKSVYNALEPPAAALAPDIALYKERLLKSGALCASMSGSGAALFGLFSDQDSARRALLSFSDAPFAYLTYI